MKTAILKTIAILAFVSLACTVSFNLPASRTGEVQTVTINEAPPTGAVARVEIRMGGGELNLSGGSSSLVSGTIEYNLEEWVPVIEREGDTVTIKQELKSIPIPDAGDVVNRWDLQLGSTPMELDIEVGAYDGKLDLGGVPIVALDISGGASNSEVRFDSPNPEVMRVLNYRTGASNVELFGLGNANFEEINFTSAAGDYTLDFSGDLRQNAFVNIDGAVGNITLIIPRDQAVEVTVEGGLRDIDTEGDWSVSDNLYSISGTGPKLVIMAEMSIGNLELVSR